MWKHPSIKLIFAGLASLTAFLAYLPSLNNGFVAWDDHVYVYENMMIRSLDQPFIKWVSTAIVAGNWHPLTMISLAIDYRLWGLDPMGYHLTNIVFHSLNTFLVFLLVYRLFKLRLGSSEVAVASVVVSLLFGLHPIHVESVSWISERKDVLYAFFYVLSIISYVKYAGGSRYLYAVSIFFFSLALLSKPMAVTLPVVLMILDYYPLCRFKRLRDSLIEKAPYFILSIIFATVCLYAQQHSSAMAPLDQYPIQGRISVPVSALGFYLYKLILPLKLVSFYPLPEEAEYFNTMFFVALISVATITICSLLLLKKNRFYISVWLYFIVTLSPVIGIIQVGNQSAADRYMYLAAIGPFLLAGAGAAILYRWLSSNMSKTLLMIAICSILLFLTSKTISQQSVWKDTISLWSNVIEESPYRKRLSAYYYRGLAYDKAGDSTKALSDLSEAIALKPKYVDAYKSRGIVFADLQQFDKAMADFNMAIFLAPTDSDAYLSRGNVYLYLAVTERAADDFRKSIDLNPKNAKAYFNLGLAYAKLNDSAKSTECFQRAAHLGLSEAMPYLNK